MPSGTVEEVQKLTVSDQVRRFGYTAQAMALSQMLKNGQRKLAAMIIVALCLAPRKGEVENKGVLKILRNIPLWRIGTADSEFVYELREQVQRSANRNKVEITLLSTRWLDCNGFWRNHETPWLQYDDGCFFLNSRKDREDREGFQRMLCDHAGCQREEYLPHFRMIYDEGNCCVRFIGRQFDRDRGTLNNSTALANGYREYLVPPETVLYNFGDHSGRTLADILEPGVWYNYYFKPDTPLDLVDHEAQAQLADARQDIANLIMKAGQLNG